MIKKQISFAILLLVWIVVAPLSTGLNAAEVDKGLVIIDNKPWKTAWVQESKRLWVLTAHFDNGTLRTYFKNPPPPKGFGLTHENKPLKQEFDFHLGKKFVSTNSQFEQWPDGAKCYAFMYEKTFEKDAQKLLFGTTAIIEEVGDAENEIRYAMYKTFE